MKASASVTLTRTFTFPDLLDECETGACTRTCTNTRHPNGDSQVYLVRVFHSHSPLVQSAIGPSPPPTKLQSRTPDATLCKKTQFNARHFKSANNNTQHKHNNIALDRAQPPVPGNSRVHSTTSRQPAENKSRSSFNLLWSSPNAALTQRQ